jgi:hypothetical protein
MCLHGIPPDVSNNVTQMIAISNEAIKVVVLPELALKPEFLMNHTRRASFPGEEHLFEQPFWMQYHEHMNVVRHYHIREQFIPLLVEVGERFDNGLAKFRLTQDTRAVPIIQPLVDAGGEESVIFRFDLW